MFKNALIKIILLTLFATALYALPQDSRPQRVKYYIPQSDFAMGMAMGSETGIVFKKFIEVVFFPVIFSSG